ncbi:S-adenosyl-L-methionine-dependent methyltransferase [Lophiostoma macrostomum CBS 122681]|uniref:S-adenosyl-L-methionine-dependent methyltransferase n=1 Tax=Lophiostoma macrostomum CBS 122681 TaxID=1314788 RepID=A0A6A6T2R1_9PLEO|nr:S-adenosyl-L-methionine-dependent methyltransferase [Lophiostoma macrostomum CBS 122681]
MISKVPTDALPYPLKRNALASTRLNYNHFWWTKISGYLLHPSIPTTLPNLRIADVGAGTGIWIHELSAALPHATFDAIDISSAQFPPEAIRPANISWWTHNAFEPFPEAYQGRFDVVNARAWKCILNDDVADRVFGHIISLLKPGGYLQWFEPVPESAHVKAPEGFGPTPACDKLVGQWKKPLPTSSYDWINDLPGTFKRNGLDVEVVEKHRTPDHFQPVGAQTVLMGIGEYLHSDASMAVYQEALSEEHARGAFVDLTWTCVVGRKPGA